MFISCEDLVKKYINYCCASPSEETSNKFSELLSENCTLIHQTNDEKIVETKGRDSISSLFKRYVFTNSFDIDKKSDDLREIGSKIQLKLIVEETKENSGVKERFLFTETTLFSFEKNETSEKYLISEIDMRVRRETLYKA